MEIDTKPLGKISFTPIKSRLASIKKSELPAFAKYKPNFDKMYAIAAKYSDKQNFIIIGRGGSTTSFKAMYHALAEYKTTKKVYFIETTDPDYCAYVKGRCLPNETLVIAISKSGTTIDVIENLMYFNDCEKLIISTPGDNAMANIAKIEKCDFYPHPEVGGRFVAPTEAALLPAAIIYLDTKKIFEGMQKMYELCNPKNPITKNPALNLAAQLFLLERRGYTAVYDPIYCQQLNGFCELIMQLMHETVCKEGKGQTYLTVAAPQSQHHSNQRFFGGRKNLIGLFIRVENFENNPKTPVPEHLKNVKIHDTTLKILDSIPLQKTLEFEYTGVQKDATKRKIPNATITLDRITPESIGELLAFFEYLAVYSALLRGVNPYDQPEVEASKEISYNLRKVYSFK